MLKIYFNNAILSVVDKNDNNSEVSLEKSLFVFDDAHGGSAEAAVAHVEATNSSATLYTTNLEEALKGIKKGFKVVRAGGGLVLTPESEALLIFRKGKWDLPKGKLDDGETLEQCALREVEEETGLKKITLGSNLTVTYHTYIEEGEKILKESHWYRMTARKQPLTAQTEEDIEQCIWVPVSELQDYKEKAHPSVADVLELAFG